MGCLTWYLNQLYLPWMQTPLSTTTQGEVLFGACLSSENSEDSPHQLLYTENAHLCSLHIHTMAFKRVWEFYPPVFLPPELLLISSTYMLSLHFLSA